MTSVSNSPKIPWDWLQAAFGLDALPVKLSRLETSGFSGAQLWSVQLANAGPLVIRRFPGDVTGERLEEIYSVLSHVAQSGCPFVPVPLRTNQDAAFAARDGAAWQIEPQLPGVADYWQRPSKARLISAMQALATWHVAAFSCGPPPKPAPAPGIVMRLQRLGNFAHGNARRMAQSLDLSSIPQRLRGEFARLFSIVIETFEAREAELSQQLQIASQRVVPHQYCIRDVWHDHVLFTGDQVSGIVDYDALRIDSVAADISRLLGSLIGGQATDWRQPMDAYCRVRRLSSDELQLVASYDRSSVLLSGLQWLDWICVERRQFDWPRVLERLRRITRRYQDG